MYERLTKGVESMAIVPDDVGEERSEQEQGEPEISWSSPFLWLFKLFMVTIAALLIVAGFMTMTRSTHVTMVFPPDPNDRPTSVGDSAFLREIALYTGTALSRRNKVQVLLNGDETNPHLWSDLRSATTSILFQSYYGQPSFMLDTLKTILIERAQAGVTVAVLLDAFGSGSLRKDTAIQEMRDGGVYVEFIRPIHWYSLNRATLRSHARAVLIDGRVGYTGGFGIADHWEGDGVTDDGWRETNVRFEGPAVAQVQAAFASGWVEATGILLSSRKFFSSALFDSAGGVLAGFMHTVPGTGSTAAERFLALSIAGARERLYITNSYAVPGPDFRTFLVDAAKRGVDVRLLTVGKKTDVKATSFAGKAFYEELLVGGVRIFEYEPTMMHAKTMVVDGKWVSIGSMNFDNRSLALNNETSLIVLDTVLGAQMDSIFMMDLQRSNEIKLEDFRRRPWYNKIMEWGAEQLWRVL